MAIQRGQIPSFVTALRKIRQRYKHDFDANLGQRNRTIKIGDYAGTINHHVTYNLHAESIGPFFVVVGADESTFIIDVDGIERRISSDHATQALRPDDDKGDTPHPLLDKPRPTPPAYDEYVIDSLCLTASAGIRTNSKFDGTTTHRK